MTSIDDETKSLCNGNTIAHKKKLHITYLQHLLDESPGILVSLRDKGFSKDYNNLLQRFSRSVSYHIVELLKSFHKLLVGNWDQGDGRGCSLWGIHPRNRPFMLLHAHEFVGYKSVNDNEDENDMLCPIPHLNPAMCKILVEQGSLTEERLEMDRQTLTDCMRSVE